MSRLREPRKQRVTVVLSDSLKNRLEDLAEDNQRTLSDFIRLVCLEYCEAIDEREAESGEEDVPEV